MRRIDRGGLVQSSMLLKGVHGYVCLLPFRRISVSSSTRSIKKYSPGLDVPKPLAKDVEVDRLWRIEVILVPKRSSTLLRCKRFVEAIHREDHHPWQAELLDNGIRQRGLSGT